ncbi:MAG: ABC-F family ATP-binding cassette domain-containing protein [Bdellovibrionales bacterium]|nr:ABC-F family ATP-binding cassette domain-containing protein [Bdellovibrionales bacterium]
MIALSNISKQYGTQILIQNGNFQIRPGDKIGLVGPNGAGKTTLFRVITRQEGVDTGEVIVPEKLVVGYFSQDTGEMSGRSALEEVKAGGGKVADLGAEIAKIEKRLEASADNPMDDDEMAALLERYGEAQSEFESRGGYDLEVRAKEALTGLGVPPEEHDTPVERFSGGWKMRIALARMLTLKPDVMLMDEPTNHLDLESILWLEEWLKNYKGSLLMTSHDREFMNRICGRTIEVANKSITTYSGNYDFYLKEREIRKEQLVAAHRRQQDMLAKEEEFIARFAARASHAAQVQSRVKKLEKIDRIEIPTEQKVMKFTFPAPPRSGTDVVRMENLAKTWKADDGREKPVFAGATGTIRRLEKVAVVGVNGAGKSTLLKIICGQTEPTSGMVQVGPSVKIGYFSQYSLDLLNPKKTILEEIHDRIPDSTLGYIRNLLGAFLFSGDDVYKKISVLSGGEKSRVILATLLANPINFLILDEPTNHLDILSREVLLDALQSFDGTVAIVSHDRHFLKAMATRVLEVDRGEIRSFGGTYEEYLRKKQGA